VDDLLSIAVSNAVAATVLALAALAVGAVYRRPALVHGLWLLVLLKLVTPPLVFLPIAWPGAAESAQEVAVAQEEPTIVPLGGSRSARPTPQAALIDPPTIEEGSAGVEGPPVVEEPSLPSSDVLPEAPLWPQMLRIVWGVGALAWFLLAMERLDHFRRLLRFARPAPAALQERTRRLAQSLGLRRCPRVRLLPGRIAPMLWAIGGSPRLLVPADLLDVLSEEQLDTLLLHELAHLRRRDHWVRILEFVVMGLYWWHPVVWYARRELREAEEQCCDAWVVSTLPGAGRTYASALLDTLDFLSTVQAVMPPLASGLGQIADLKRRLTMIMQGNTPRSLTWPGCLAVVALGLTILPMLPSLHGQAPRKEEARDQLEEAEKALEKAKTALERQKAEMDRKMSEFKAAQVRARVVESVRSQAHTQIGEAEKKATFRIEITVPADENMKEILAKIRKALPEKLHGNIALRPVTVNTPSGGWGEQPAARPAPPRIEFTAPTTPQHLTVPVDPAGVHSRGASSEKRINELEKKLEKVLRELQEMRKQMKQPRGGPAYRVPTPVQPNASPATPLPEPVPASSAAPPTPPVPASTAAPPTPPVPAQPAAPPTIAR
jgi:beta-lactamase regulating signal transducer with metallopeptidase domain